MNKEKPREELWVCRAFLTSRKVKLLKKCVVQEVPDICPECNDGYLTVISITNKGTMLFECLHCNHSFEVRVFVEKEKK